MVDEVLEETLSKDYWEGGLAGPNRFVKLSEWAPKKGRGQKQGAIAPRPSGVGANISRLASARNKRSSVGGCAPQFEASSAMVLGPEASRSGIRSFAATWIACAARMPGQMYSMGLVDISDCTDLTENGRKLPIIRSSLRLYLQAAFKGAQILLRATPSAPARPKAGKRKALTVGVVDTNWALRRLRVAGAWQGSRK
jgi:hypothetical protein